MCCCCINLLLLQGWSEGRTAGIDLSLRFSGPLQNGTTAYSDDGQLNAWSIELYPNNARLVVVRDGFQISSNNGWTEYRDDVPGFHFVEAIATFDGSVSRSRLYYTLLARDRGITEWGLPPFKPRGYAASAESTLSEWFRNGSRPEILHPHCFLTGQESVPLVVRMVDSLSGTLSPVNMEVVAYLPKLGPLKGSRFRVIRGSGSGFVTVPDSISIKDSLVINFRVGQNSAGQATIPICVENRIQHLPARLRKPLHYPKNSLLRNMIGSNVTIELGGSLHLCGDSMVLLDPDVYIHIKTGGQLHVSKCGDEVNPAIFTSYLGKKHPWGGVRIETAESSVMVEFAFFALSGSLSKENSGLGHRGETPVFRVTSGAYVRLDEVFLFSGAGQGIVAVDSKVDIFHSLVQRFTCGLQTQHSNITVIDSVFADFPALERPYEDSDHDAMYIVGGRVTIFQSLVGYAMDDCIDSGTGPGGHLNITNTIIESCYHEGIALSDNGWNVEKAVLIRNVLVRDNQQGIELGFSTHLHSVDIYDATIMENFIGLRIGDNYGWATEGIMRCTKCSFLKNEIGIRNLHAGSFAPMSKQLILRNCSLQISDGLQNSEYIGQGHRNDGSTRESMSDCIEELKEITLTVTKAGRESYLKFCGSDHIESEESVSARVLWASVNFCQQIGCTIDERNQIFQTVVNLEKNSNVGKELSKSFISGHNEHHLLIVWSNVPTKIRHDITALLCANATTLSVISTWKVDPTNTSEGFDENWFENFYGSKYYMIYEPNGQNTPMTEHKGKSSFLCFLLLDRHPVYFMHETKGHVNKNIYTLKHNLRTWLPQIFSIHATQTAAEFEADSTWLFGSAPLEVTLSQQTSCTNPRRSVYVDVFSTIATEVPLSFVSRSIARGEFTHFKLDVQEIQRDVADALSYSGVNDRGQEMSDLYAGAILGQARFPIVMQTPWDTKWYTVLVPLRSVADMFVLNTKDWIDIGGGPCKKVSYVATRIKEKIEARNLGNDHTAKIYRMLLDQAKPEPLLTAVTRDFVHYTLFDGNHRSILFLLSQKQASMNVNLIVGHSTLFSRPYQGNFYCKGEGNPQVPITEKEEL